VQALEVIKQKVGPDNVAISAGYVGQVPSSYPINTIYLWTSGPEEAVLRVALKPDSGFRVEDLKEQLRRDLPAALGNWLRGRLTADKLPPEQVEARVAALKLSFGPADIINEVMSFGSPTPVEVAVSGLAFTGPDKPKHFAYVEKVRAELAKIPSLRDLQQVQPLDYPAVAVQIDRPLAGASGITTQDVANSLVAATSSSRFVVPNYWPDPSTGIGYQVQVEIPITRMDSARQIGLVPIKHPPQAPSASAGTQTPSASAGTGRPSQLFLQDVAHIREGSVPGEYDRYNSKRLVSFTANVYGEDLGRVASHISAALAAAGEPPRGLRVDVRGQITPMQEMFTGLLVGLALAVTVIFLLLAGYFQSLRLALVVMLAAPAVIAGVAVLLWATHTTLNVQSFMGAIMAVGVATANAILLVTFAERARREGADALAAAVDAGRHRLRPILMTSCAMIAGMVPMALALGEGGEQTAPLGRAVIGGLVAATVTTLLVLPALFALVQGRSGRHSASLDPDDAESPYFDGGENRRPLAGAVLAVAVAVLSGMTTGCQRSSPAATPREQAVAPPAEAAVRVVRPQRKTVRHPIEQPGFNIEAFQETPLYAKVAGYVGTWDPRYDIGRTVRKGEVLAELSVPEMEVELRQKQAALQQAVAQVQQAKAAVLLAQAQLERYESQFRRLERVGKKGVLSEEGVEESRLGYKASQASLEKAKADVAAAEANREVAEANRDYAKTMLNYTRIRAPYDGVLTRRNVNLGDFVQPAATGAKGQPLFVVSQLDPVRIFVNVLGADAPWIKDGDPVSLRLQGAGGEEFQGRVTRNARSLEPQARTLRTEIDVPNPGGKLLPGMYVQATITVQHANTWTLPAAAILTEGEQTFCYRVENGKAVRTPLQVGLRGGGLVEVLKKQTTAASPGEERQWEDVTGQEEVVATEGGSLSEGQGVQASPAADK
jgi:RND family efflux transporter MFP subunit